jgi:UDP:flavonoid glycosyltransferase YjiC (YdhE family)
VAREFVPGDRAAAEAALVVCNGGSSTGYQALREGTPVVGLPFNLDQYLAMTAIERAGAGVLVRSGTATAENVREACLRALTLREGARAATEKLRALDPAVEFVRVVDELTA